MAFFTELLEFVAPTRCAGCDAFGALLCSSCLEEMHRYQTNFACRRCAAPFGELVCTECWDEAFVFTQALALGTFEPPLAKSVVVYKDKNEQRIACYLGVLLGMRALLAYGRWADLVTWVPPSRKALRRRGFDHGALLAQSIAEVLGVEALATCQHVKDFDLRPLSKEQRKAAVAGGFRLMDTGCARSEMAVHLAKRSVLLVDDVMTTGSTLNEVARLLLDAGAREVRVAVIARTW